MESEKQSTERETPPQNWKSCKLIIDPALTKGLYKVCRYDGQYFNIPVEDLGLFPVDTVRDPRICRIWSKCNKTELLVPKFKLDEWYVGPVPPREVTFLKMNDNVRETFLTDMCKKYGNVEEVEIFYNPKNKKHLGIAKVVFDTVRAAKNAVQHLHHTSVMGNIIHVEIDPKGDNRARYLQLLLSGLYTPWTLPVGSSEEALQSLVDSLMKNSYAPNTEGGTATQRWGRVFSPASIATPLSLDTAYSSIWQDTPCSFRLTPQSQGTPRTPFLCATPLSQDSCYSSLQATPVLQGEIFTSSVQKPFRQDLCHHKPVRHQRRSSQVSNVSLLLNHCQPHPPHIVLTEKETNSHQLDLWCHNAKSSTNKEPFANFASSLQESNSTSVTVPQNGDFDSILSLNFTAERETLATSPRNNNPPEEESLDARIESLLTKTRITNTLYFERKTLESHEHSQDSPASPCSTHNGTFSNDSLFCPSLFKSSHKCPCSDVVDASTALLTENEEKETNQDSLFVSANSSSQSSKEDTERCHLSFSKVHHGVNEDTGHFRDISSGSLTPAKDTFSGSKSLSIPSFSCSTQKIAPPAPPAATAGCSRPPGPPFPILPFPPSLLPVPPRLPNGTIPIPPPGWIPPPGIPIPPLPIPPPPSIPPPTFLVPPPPLMVPPPVLPPVHTCPLPVQLAGSSEQNKSISHTSAPFSFPQPPWPPFLGINPFVPPPDYCPAQENPHRMTIEKVLEILSDELKSIIKKDIMRRMIEGVAFKSFEDWWDCQEKKAKVSSFKSGAMSMEERNKLKNPLSRISGQCSKPSLPSFKVKRKRSEETEKPNFAHEGSDVRQGDDTAISAPERAKRRHARPLELDSDDDNKEKENNTLQDGNDKDDNLISDWVEAVKSLEDDLSILSDRDDRDDEDQPGEENMAQDQRNDEDAVICRTPVKQLLNIEIFSESSSSEESDCSSDFESSNSFYSGSFEDTSSDLGTEDEEMAWDEGDKWSVDCIVISDEDSVELGPPATPSAPLTPGPQFDQDLQNWLDRCHCEQTEENHMFSQQGHRNTISMMELQPSESWELQPGSPLGISALEPELGVEMGSPKWPAEFLENLDSLRPPTPTGCLMDSDPDILIKSKPSSPAVEEVQPPTPGKGMVAELASAESEEVSEVFSPSSASSELLPAPFDLLPVSYPSYKEMPKTPGREERCLWVNCSYERAPATPGRGTMSGGHTESSALRSPHVLPPSSIAYVTPPKTPGRDIVLPGRAVVHRRKTEMMDTTPPLLCNNFLGSPITVSSPCSLSDSSPDSANESSVPISSGVRSKPLQGLENMPGLLDEEKSLLRQKLWKRLKHRSRARHRQRSFKIGRGCLISKSRPLRCRSLCEERRILHSIWKAGLDEEDARHLQCTYERLRERDDDFGWLRDTPWIPHPLTKGSSESREGQTFWQPLHRTGSARSEGFYKISRRDKMKYLNDTNLSTDLPSTSAQQGTCIPAQQPSSLRAGSDFRSEQRRLLSSFSCDSDLVRFNQLKFRKKKIRFTRSHIHEWGLFAMEPIAADEMVIEYVGQIIRQVIADMREQRYEDEGIGSSYLFRVDQDTIIDATKCGNLARFINHSCNPNCYAKIITVESQKKIVIYSRQPISVNEEITYDYKFPIEDTKIPCLCGADSCRGSLN